MTTTTTTTVDLFDCPQKPCNVAITECGMYLRGIDLLLGVLETRNAADKAMKKRVQPVSMNSNSDENSENRDQSPAIFSKKMKFPGHRQKSYAWDAKTAIDVVMDLPGPRAMEFRRVACKNIMRLLGGDQTLHAEIDRNAASTSNAAKFFQKAVAVENARDIEWHEHRKTVSKPAHNEMAASVANKNFEIKTSIRNCQVVHGVTPKEYGGIIKNNLKDDEKVKNLKDYYPKKQLMVSSAFLAQITTNSEPELDRIGGLFETLCKGLNFHHTPQTLTKRKGRVNKKLPGTDVMRNLVKK